MGCPPRPRTGLAVSGTGRSVCPPGTGLESWHLADPGDDSLLSKKQNMYITGVYNTLREREIERKREEREERERERETERETDLLEKLEFCAHRCL